MAKNPESKFDKLVADYKDLRARAMRITVRGAVIPADMRLAIAAVALELAEYFATDQ